MGAGKGRSGSSGVRACGCQPLASPLTRPGQRLEPAATAARYQEETSDPRSSAPLLLRISVCPPYMRLPTNCFFYGTLPLLFFSLYCYSIPRPHLRHPQTDCIHTFKRKINLLLLQPRSKSSSSLCDLLFSFPFLSPHLSSYLIPVMRLGIVHLTLPSNAQKKKKGWVKRKIQGGPRNRMHETRTEKFLKTLFNSRTGQLPPTRLSSPQKDGIKI